MTYQIPPEDIKIFIESLRDYNQSLQNYNMEGNIEIKKECEKTNFLIDYLNKNEESYFIELSDEEIKLIKSNLIILLGKLTDEKEKMILGGEPMEAIEGLNKKILKIEDINEYKCFKDISPKNLIMKVKKRKEEVVRKDSEEIFKLEPEIYGIGIKLKPFFKKIKRLFKK